MENFGLNYIRCGGLLRLNYMYVDVNRDRDYFADGLFVKRKIPVHFKKEMEKEGDKYRIIFCSINKKHKKQFEEALEELITKMNLCGFTDYEEYCHNLMEELDAAE